MSGTSIGAIKSLMLTFLNPLIGQIEDVEKFREAFHGINFTELLDDRSFINWMQKFGNGVPLKKSDSLHKAVLKRNITLE